MHLINPRFDSIFDLRNEATMNLQLPRRCCCRVVVAPSSAAFCHFSNLLLVSATLSNILGPNLSCRAAMMSTTPPGNNDDPVPIRTKQLQDLWSTSFDAWIDVPQHDEPIVYLRPQNSPQQQDDGNSCQSTTTVRLPAICHQVSMYALTGYNPMGQDQPADINVAANNQLRQDLSKLDWPKPRYIWPAFGFSHNWREDGFVAAYDKVDQVQGEAAIVALALKYQQGAIFGFDVIENEDAAFVVAVDDDHGDDCDENGDARKAQLPLSSGQQYRLLRRTIPAAMSNVEADVVVVPCAKPEGMANAEYHDVDSTTTTR
jgi:hypothetical protein